MVKTLTKHGNSLALVIDKSILELLGIKPTTPLRIKTDGTNLLISPIHEKRDKLFQKSLQRTNARYKKVFKKLAE